MVISKCISLDYEIKESKLIESLMESVTFHRLFWQKTTNNNLVTKDNLVPIIRANSFITKVSVPWDISWDILKYLFLFEIFLFQFPMFLSLSHRDYYSI